MLVDELREKLRKVTEQLQQVTEETKAASKLVKTTQDALGKSESSVKKAQGNMRQIKQVLTSELAPFEGLKIHEMYMETIKQDIGKKTDQYLLDIDSILARARKKLDKQKTEERNKSDQMNRLKQEMERIRREIERAGNL